MFPKARSEHLVVTRLGEETLVYDTQTHQAHCLNPPAAAIWAACDGETALPDIAGVPEVVLLGLKELDRARLLDPGMPSGMSRRELLKKAGRVAAVLPVVGSILVPSPARATSCLPAGSTCTSPGQCCSGNCLLGTCGR